MNHVEFAIGTLRGLGQAVVSDPDLFLLAAGTLVGGRVQKGVTVWFLARRADQYVGVLSRDIRTIGQVTVND
jgi:hypothetical protein